MKNERITASLNRVRMTEAEKAALLARILIRADEERAHAAQGGRDGRRARASNAAVTLRRRKKKALGWLAPVAALLLAAILLFSIPGAAQAIRDWFYDAFRADRYLYVPPEKRRPNADFDSAIVPREELEQTNRILLLSETDEYAEIDAARKKYGSPAYDPSAWGWVAEIQPTITDLYYDGADFVVMTFLPCDPLPFMSGYIGGVPSSVTLDVLSLDEGTITNLDTGESQPLAPSSFGLVPQRNYRNDDGSANLANILSDGGVRLYTEYVMPNDPPLAPGRYRIEIRHRVLDAAVADMSPLGTIAVLEQTFVLDTHKALAAVEQQTLPSVAFSGTYPFTVHRETEEGIRFSIEPFDLTGYRITPTVQTRPTGLRVLLDETFPGDWDKLRRDSVRGGIEYELFLDGASSGFVFIEGDDTHRWIDLPVVASERAQLRSLLLRPAVRTITHITVDGTPYALSDGYLLPYDVGCDASLMETVPLPECEIVLPAG